MLKAGKEGEFEREGYGQRPYDNFETIMFPTAGQVSFFTFVEGCYRPWLAPTVLLAQCAVPSLALGRDLNPSSACNDLVQSAEEHTGDKCSALQDFDDVMQAISSNSARWGITDVKLRLRRVRAA